MDMHEYIEVFREEVKQNTDEAEKILLNLEGDMTPEQSQTIERNAHTLKSSAALMGFNSLSELCKELEYLMRDLIDKGNPPNQEIIETLKKSFENIRKAGLSLNEQSQEKELVDENLIQKVREHITK